VEFVRIAYAVAVPPTWTRLPLRVTPAPAIAALVASVPLDDAGQTALRAALHEQVLLAQGSRGVDLYLPVAELITGAVSASFVVSLPPSAGGDGDAHDDVLHAMAERYGPAARELTLAGSPAVRVEQVVGAEHEQLRRRTVDYLTVVPAGFGRWLGLSFGTRPGADPDDESARDLVAQFDAIVDTFRWVS
jgi:hypothetical protein